MANHPWLTDRWGDLNSNYESDPAYAKLEKNTVLLEELQKQMWDEITFIAHKDGRFGILFEVEYCSKESEEDDGEEWYANLKPQAEVVKILMDGMKLLAEKFPGVQFAVPDEAVIVQNRPAAWAFVPAGLLTPEQREELGNAMLSL